MQGAVILGAGFARRFGSDKRMHPLGESTVARATLAKYLTVFDHVRVVVRADDAALQDHIADLPVTVVTTAQAQLGLGHSFHAGFHNLSWDYTFVGLLDMPYVETQTLQRLCAQASALNHTGILRPQLIAHDSKASDDLRSSDDSPPWGHPIGFPRALFQEFADLTGDEGARSILKKHAHAVVEFPTTDTGVVRDIDRPSDLI